MRATGARRGSGEAEVLLQGRNRSLRQPSDQLSQPDMILRRIVQIDDLFFLNEIMFDPVRGEGREVLGSMAGGVVP